MEEKSKLKKVYINPGHSNTDPGAVSKYGRERDLVVQVAKYMESYLKKHYMVLTKSNPGTVGNLNTITSEANNWGANLFVSIHFNSAAVNTADGAEVLVYDKNNRGLGNVFWKHIKSIGQNPHGSDPIKYRPDLAVLRLTNMKAVLIECAYINNWNDIKDWNEPKELETFGIALAKAAAEVLKLPEKIQVPTYETLCDLNLRKSNNLNSEIIGLVPKGTKVSGTLYVDGWLKINYNNKNGFIRQKGKKVYCKPL